MEMLAPKRFKRPVARAVSASISAPLLGWNARDSLADMDPLDAVILENYFPQGTYIQLRYGYSRHATGIPAQVETVMAAPLLSSNKLLAAAGTEIYDVTAGGAVGAAVQTGLTNARWQYIDYSNTSGNYVYMVNGADAPRYWDGTTWTNAAITGVTPASLIHINAHKSRVWFVEENSLNAWYLPTNALAGAATKFALQGVATRGGYLMAMATWTIDAGYGVDDLAVFVTSVGDVVVYRGTDVASSATWALVGVFEVGAPVGRKCFIKYAGDLLLLCRDGVEPLSGYLQSSRTNPKTALTDRIQQAMSESTTLYGENYGWQMLQFSKENMLFLNVPVQEGNLQEQYVMNTITKAWCKFTGWNANCWELFEDNAYFGGNGFVGKAWDTLEDNEGEITADALQAFNYFGSPAIQKRFTMLRPTLQTNGVPAVLAALNIDFDLSDNTSPLSFAAVAYAIWSSSLWSGGIWGSSLVTSRVWQGASGIGYCAGVRLKTTSQGIALRWVATDVVGERGGIL